MPFGKFVTGVLCFGSGHSMGREGPSVQIGSGLASLIGRWLRLPLHRVRDLVPVGAAGALAAATQPSSSSRTARHVMRADVPFVQPQIPVEEAWRWLIEHEVRACLVGERLEGVATREQLAEWRASGRAGETVASLVDESFVHAHVDHPIDVVLERLAESGGLLPVVSRTEARRVEGVITAESILARDSRPARTRRSA